MNRYLIANQKGGILKTTTAVHLAHNRALAGQCVLLIDTDSQGNCAKYFGFDPWDGFGMAVVTGGKMPDSSILKEVRPGVHLMSGSKHIGAAKATLTGVLSNAQDAESYFNGIMAKYDGDFDCIIIDSSPSWDILNATLLFWAERVIIPTTMETLSIQGVIDLLQMVKRVRERRPELEVSCIVPTKTDNRFKSTKEFIDAIKAPFGDLVSSVTIRTNQKFEYACGQGKTIYEIGNRKGMEDFDALAQEVFNG